MAKQKLLPGVLSRHDEEIVSLATDLKLCRLALVRDKERLDEATSKLVARLHERKLARWTDDETGLIVTLEPGAVKVRIEYQTPEESGDNGNDES